MTILNKSHIKKLDIRLLWDIEEFNVFLDSLPSEAQSNILIDYMNKDVIKWDKWLKTSKDIDPPEDLKTYLKKYPEFQDTNGSPFILTIRYNPTETQLVYNHTIIKGARYVIIEISNQIGLIQSNVVFVSKD